MLERKLRFQPLVQLLHQRSTVLLMKRKPLGGRKPSLARLRIIFIDIAQSLQNITTLLREVRGHFYKLPSSMREAVGQQDLRAIT